MPPFIGLNTGKKKVSFKKQGSAQKQITSQGSYSSGEESKTSKRNVHYIRYKKSPESNNNNLIIERDGQNLGDLNFRGPIQNISLNENKELEISFGAVLNHLHAHDNKLYDSQNFSKTEVVRVPLGGYDSDESIEVNIDIDWPRKSEEKKKPKDVADGPKEPRKRAMMEDGVNDRIEKQLQLNSPESTGNPKHNTGSSNRVRHV